MNILPLILACLLLCGCADRNNPEEAVPPTEIVAQETSRPEEYGGKAEKTPLNLSPVQGLYIFHSELLLLSGQDSTRLTLLDPETLDVRAAATLEVLPEDIHIRLQPDGTLSFFDPVRQETVVMDRTLSVLNRIETPGAATAPPVLCGNTLYYCTPTHLRCWELDTGLRRCIREMAFDGQVLTEVLQDGTVLQCTVSEAGRQTTCFFSSADGSLLSSLEGRCSVRTLSDRYYARLPAGANQISVFGTGGSEPQLLTPEDPEADVWFLPEAHLLLAATPKGLQTELCLYDLKDGSRKDRLVLDVPRGPGSVQYLDGKLWMLIPEQACLLTWTPENAGAGNYLSPYRDRDLSGLQQKADALGSTFGIRILIGPEAENAAPPGYCFQAEPLPTLLRRELALLEQRLSQYPGSVLSQTAGHFSSLTVCILRSIRDSGQKELPELQFLDGTDAYVAIATGDASGQNLYHSLFHLMETHIYSRSKALDQWNDLNPAGFQYDYDYDANASRDSGVYLFQDHRAFVDTYSMSFPKEDRARVLEYAMLPGQEDLFRTEAMQKKLRTLCTSIREAFDLEDAETPLLWEQYLD